MNDDGLLQLLKVENEQDLKRICKMAHRSHTEDEDVALVVDLLSTDRQTARSVLSKLNSLANFNNPEKLRSQFPETFPKTAADMIANAIVETRSGNLTSVESSLMPQLKDFNWRVDVKVASDAVSRMSVPTCLLQLQIVDPSRTSGGPGGERKMNVELTREAMDTVLDGLGKIRDQLSNIAK